MRKMTLITIGSTIVDDSFEDIIYTIGDITLLHANDNKLGIYENRKLQMTVWATYREIQLLMIIFKYEKYFRFLTNDDLGYSPRDLEKKYIKMMNLGSEVLHKKEKDVPERVSLEDM